jgi:hypothetical protein
MVFQVKGVITLVSLPTHKISANIPRYLLHPRYTVNINSISLFYPTLTRTRTSSRSPRLLRNPSPTTPIITTTIPSSDIRPAAIHIPTLLELESDTCLRTLNHQRSTGTAVLQFAQGQ